MTTPDRSHDDEKILLELQEVVTNLETALERLRIMSVTIESERKKSMIKDNNG